ncbi:hypothetical protein CHS0354_012766 [Potamilus streckersoni]|uniref:C1q domain-containing protein n=1 Tax=Potamilus streckersoni TaxID=2493646 RepID=A0AAE0RV89_9BIVA|nr:hypothetical protein CHS0354_012766 [Potamilus streckersoni]
MDMVTILLIDCLVISCYAFFLNAAEHNKDFETNAIFTLMKRIDAMGTKIEYMERLANEAREREKMMLGRIEYLEEMRSQCEILTNKLLTRQEVMQREIRELSQKNHDQQEHTTLLDLALSDVSADEKENITGNPAERNTEGTKEILACFEVKSTHATLPKFHPTPTLAKQIKYTNYIRGNSVLEANSDENAQVIKYDGVLTNEGNGYNPVTGIFTCPEDGIYLFSFFTATVHEHKAWVELLVDGVQINHAVSEGVRGGHDDQGGNVAILRLRAGQSVWTAISHGADTELDGVDGYRHVTFSGVRLSA